MKLASQFILLLLYLKISNTVLYSSSRKSLNRKFSRHIRATTKPSRREIQWIKEEEDPISEFPEFVNRGVEDDVIIQKKPEVRIFRAQLDDAADLNQGMRKKDFHIDPVLNGLRKNFRRLAIEFNDSLSSISAEDFKEKYQESWFGKKLEAINQTVDQPHWTHTAANQPWGVPCGDPNEHDIPWGTCMLPQECEPEFRIYRGDMSCLRTRLICCVVMTTTYDLYQGFDLSLREDSMPTDSEQERLKTMASRERRVRIERKEHNKRVKDREVRKKKMKKDKKKIDEEFGKILTKQFRNRSKERRLKTLQLQDAIKAAKNQFRLDRDKLIGYRDNQISEVDLNLYKRLQQMLEMNEAYISNSTFRDIIVYGPGGRKPKAPPNGSRSRRVLGQTAPAAAARPAQRPRRDPHRSHIFDIEYGYLYY